MLGASKTKIVSILNQKGGAGKTTIATNLTRMLCELGYKALLVDSDPQGSARDWHAVTKKSIFPVIGLDRETLDNDIYAINGYDIIIIDGAPQIAKLCTAAVKCSDLVVIPVQPSPYDLWACADLVDIIRARREVAYNRPDVAFLLSRVLKNTKLEGEAKEALQNYKVPLLSAFTSQRVAYPTTANDGLTVLDSNDSKAIQEIKEITNEILKRLENGIKLEASA